MEVILDTNFILYCVREKVDFLEAEKYGRLVLAKQIIEELTEISKKGEKKDKEAAQLAIRIIENNKNKFEIVDLGVHFADLGIENYVKNKNAAVATMDKGLQRRIKGRAKLIILRGKKKIVET